MKTLIIAVFSGLLAVASLSSVATVAEAQDDARQLVPPPEGQQNDADIWRAIRQGQEGYVSIPDGRAGQLIQSEGELWRSVRNGPLSTYGVWLLLGTVGLLALFFALRGRIRIEHGRSDRKILRFALLERLIHWLTAVSFIVLALTGLNVLYGRYVLIPVMGPADFAAMTMAGNTVHHYVGFLFMFGIFMMFIVWLRHNVPNRHDIIWLLKAGGMLGRGVHPPARKFNAGQKIIFAAVIAFGAAISFSGLSLLYPFEAGFTTQDMQLTQLLHSASSLVLTALIIAHIYIGTLGMEGAFEAMGTGYVDANWAKAHHSLWVAELEQEEAGDEDTTAQPAPAE